MKRRPHVYPSRQACCICTKPAEAHTEVCTECKRVVR